MMKIGGRKKMMTATIGKTLDTRFISPETEDYSPTEEEWKEYEGNVYSDFDWIEEIWNETD